MRIKNHETQNMQKLTLKKVIIKDKRHFLKWWNDRNLQKLTSGIVEKIKNKEFLKYFKALLNDKNARHFLILLGKRAIGHIALAEKKNGWSEIQVIIGKSKDWNKGYGARAIKKILVKAETLGVSKIYVLVRPENKRAIRAYEKCGFKHTGIKKYPRNKYLPKALKMELSRKS